MAFPQVAATASTTNAAATSHSVNLPAGMVSGGLVVLVVGGDANPTITEGSGDWTRILHLSAFNTQNKLAVFYRFTNGSEASTVTITFSVSEELAARAFRITGHHASEVPAVSTGTDGGAASTTPNPDSLDPGGWAAEDTLWFAVCDYDSSPTVSTYPTNYTNGANDRSSTLMGIGTAYRELNASSEDPGNFTISASQEWAAATVAIRPSAGGGGGSSSPRLLGLLGCGT